MKNEDVFSLGAARAIIKYYDISNEVREKMIWLVSEVERLNTRLDLIRDFLLRNGINTEELDR